MLDFLSHCLFCLFCDTLVPGIYMNQRQVQTFDYTYRIEASAFINKSHTQRTQNSRVEGENTHTCSGRTLIMILFFCMFVVSFPSRSIALNDGGDLSDGGGSALFISNLPGPFTLTSCVFNSSSSPHSIGGAVFFETMSQNVFIEKCAFDNCTAAGTDEVHTHSTHTRRET